MNIIIILVILSLLAATGFLLAFIWSVKDGQYDDIEGPSNRILFEDNINKD